MSWEGANPNGPGERGHLLKDLSNERTIEIEICGFAGGLERMVKITPYGGVGEIGGNKFLVEDGDARIFLDMGQSFSFGEEFFTGFLMPRSRFGLRDLLSLKLIPWIRGLYSEASLEPTDFKYEEPRFSAIVLSHAHFDHSFHLKYVDESIPVHLGEGTKIIMDSWQETSSVDFGPHDFRPFRTGRRVDIDGVELEPIHVDHSIPGAYGILLHTSEGVVAYTGDFRKHGPHAHMSNDFLDKLREERPIALLCEGTRVMPEERRKNYTEAEVKSRSENIVKRAKNKLVVVTFYPRDVDRMKTFYSVAKETGREFVISTRAAHLLMALKGDPGIKVPDVLADDDVRIYMRSLQRRDSWERRFEDVCVDSEYVQKNQGKIILQLDFFHFAELVDIRPKRGSEFIHSKSEPFEEDDIEEEVMRNWLDFFGLRHHQLHASGHCNMEEIREFVQDVRPRTLIPVHTEYPELFSGWADKVVVPEMGKSYTP